MYFEPQIEAIIAEVARRYHADPTHLRAAIEHESAAELAAALRIDPAQAAQRMESVQRILTMQMDWGAGCKLLTDDVQAELRAAIAAW